MKEQYFRQIPRQARDDNGGAPGADQQARDDIRDDTEEDSDRIATLGIPTCGRPEIVARCLRSYMENAAQFGRTLRFIVVDDSRQPEMAKATKESVSELAREYPHELIYLGRPQRVSLADRFAKAAGVPAQITRHALLGDERCSVSHGAARNTLLLATAGQLSVQVDDDTVCEITSTENGEQKTVLAEKPEIDTYAFFASRQEALRSGSPAEADFLGLHERLLGRPLHAVMDANQGPSPDDAIILNTFLGVRGDSGMRSSLNRLFLSGDSFEKLTQEAESYRQRLFTREILRSPLQPSAGTARPNITINIGFDQRGLLPPFPPDLRVEDAVFGETVGLCIPHGFKGYLPFTIAHDPTDSRTAIEEVTTLPPRFNDLMTGVLSSFAAGLPSDDPAVNIPLLGMYLAELAQSPVDVFRDYVIKVGQRMVQESIVLIEQALAAADSGPVYWKRDMHTLKEANADVLQTPDFYTPVDLETSPSEKWPLARDLMVQYAVLLKNWPALVAAAPACFQFPSTRIQ